MTTDVAADAGAVVVACSNFILKESLSTYKQKKMVLFQEETSFDWHHQSMWHECMHGLCLFHNQ